MTLTLTPDQAAALRRVLEQPRERPRDEAGFTHSRYVEAPSWAADERALRDVLAMLTRPTRSTR
jgi:hypothetical protein